MEVEWREFSKEKPQYGRIVIIAGEESSFDNMREYDIAVYKQYEFSYDPTWTSQDDLCKENPHFEGLYGGWIDNPQYWMYLPEL